MNPTLINFFRFHQFRIIILLNGVYYNQLLFVPSSVVCFEDSMKSILFDIEIIENKSNSFAPKKSLDCSE